MTITLITVNEAKEKQQEDVLWLDIRSVEEYQREHIEGAINLPLQQLSDSDIAKDKPVIFYCLSGMRTKNNLEALAAKNIPTSYILEGGLNRWKAQGGKTILDTSQPIEIMRQVQIAAGSFVLLGCLLGFTVHPLFYLISGAVGAGLIFAGITGFCGMAQLLIKMPWNRK